MTGLRSRTRTVRRARSATLPTAVIVPVDGTVGALSALPLAAALAAAFGAELHRATVTTATSEPRVIDLTQTDAGPTGRCAPETDATAPTGPAPEAARPAPRLPALWTASGPPPDVTVTGAPQGSTERSDHLAVVDDLGDRDLVLTGDSPAAALATYTREHPGALLCIGSRARGGLHRRLVGNTTDELLRRAAGPVVAVGPQLDPAAAARPATILVAAGAHLPADTVPIVSAWAVMLDAEVVVANVATSRPSEAGGSASGSRPSAPEVDRLVRAFATQGIAATGYTLPGAGVTAALLGLADRLGGPVLIAAPIGSRRGRTGSDVTHELLRQGRWPVLAGVGPQD